MRLQHIIIVIMMLATGVMADKEYGTYFERECSRNSCTQINYVAPTYYQANGQWQPINTNIQNIGCIAGFGYCMTQSYYQLQTRSTLNNTDAFVMSYFDDEISFRPSALRYGNRNRNIIIATTQNIATSRLQNSLQFNNSFLNGIDLEYRAQPSYLKSNLIIQNNLTLPPNILSGDVNLSFETEIRTSLRIEQDQSNINFINASHDVIFIVPQPYAQDARGRRAFFNHSITPFQDFYIYTIDVPLSWLTNQNRTYPITIDPTIVLNESNILFDGWLLRGIGECDIITQRDGTALTLLVAFQDGDICDNYYRSVIEWNLTDIPSNAVIDNVNLTLYFEQLTDSGETDYYIKNMTSNSTTYPDTETDNINFWVDAGDGLLYSKESVVATGYYSFNLSPESHDDIQYKLQSSIDWFGVGIHLDELVGYALRTTDITSSEGAAAQRPRLQIDYSLPFAPYIILDYPANATVFLNNSDIFLNWTTYSDFGNVTLKMYGSNTTSFLDNNHIIYMSHDVQNTTITAYNWTVPPWNVDKDTMLLYHFDNLTEYQETTAKISNFALPIFNTTANGNPAYNYTNEIMGAIIQLRQSDANAQLVDGCLLQCMSLDNRTYMMWIKSLDLTQATAALFGAYDEFNFLGFKVQQDSNDLNIYSDADRITISNFFTSIQSWEHLAVVTRSNGTVDVYKNGIFLQTGQLTTITDPLLDFYVGSANIESGVGFTGNMDEFILVNRSLDKDAIYNATHLSDGTWFWQGDAVLNTTINNLSTQWEFNISAPFEEEFITHGGYQGEFLFVDLPEEQDQASSQQDQGLLRTFLTKIWGLLVAWIT